MPQSTYSLSFGGSDYATASGAGIPAAADGAELAISFWVEYASDAALYCFIQQEAVNSNWDVRLQSGLLRLCGNFGGSATLDVTAPSAGAWHHVVAQVKNYVTGVQFSTAEIYVDGSLAGSAGGSSTLRFANGGGAIDLGRFADAGVGGLDGKMDDVAIFNRLLTGSEVAGIAAGTTDVSTLSPVYLWRLEEGSGITAADSAGGRTATITGATWGTDVPPPLTGGGSPPPPPAAVFLPPFAPGF